MSTHSSPRPVGIVAEPLEEQEGAGVLIRRTIGSARLALLDPYLLLDHVTVATGDRESVGFPRHPHRGIETLSWVVSGRVRHVDSMGNDDEIGANGSQWMTAGAGLFHSEMLQVGPEGNEMIQLWFNLPAARKMIPPQYRAARSHEIPVVDAQGGAQVRVIAGAFGGVSGPFVGIAVEPIVLDVTLPPGASAALPAPSGETTVAYVYRGAAAFGTAGGGTSTDRLVIFADGDGVTSRATGDRGTRFLFVSARPLREPVLQYRSLVMNTVDEMKQALDDLENGTFAR
jgi:redox-sensitive bicupin YhaK (pirin superfamily)